MDIFQGCPIPLKQCVTMQLFLSGFPVKQRNSENLGKLLLQPNITKALAEFADLTSGIQEFMIGARPGRMGQGVDIQLHGIPWFAPGGAGLKGCAICHDNVNFMVGRVSVWFHDL